MDVVPTKAVIEDHHGDVGDGAEVSKLLSLEREPLFDSIPPNVLNHSDRVHHKSRHEEEDDPVLLSIVPRRDKVGVEVGPVAQTKALHEESVEEQCHVRADYFVPLQLIKFVDEEEGAPGVDIHLVSRPSLQRLVIVLITLFCDGDLVLLGLRSLPVNHVDVEGALVKVDLEEDVDEFAAEDPGEEPIVLYKVLPVGLVGRHEAVDALLQFEKDEPIPCHEENEPEEDRAEEVDEVDEGRNETCPALVIAVLRQTRFVQHNVSL